MFLVHLFITQMQSSLGDTLKKEFYITDPYVDLNTAILATIMLIIFGAIAGYIPAKRAA